MAESHINNFSVNLQNNHLSFCGQDYTKIPPALGNMYGDKIQNLDLSYNNLETLRGLEAFPRLRELVLDNNRLGDRLALPPLPALRTLSLNNNLITDLEGLVDKLCQFPRLSYLSLLRNAACPHRVSHEDKDDADYQRYRYYVLYRLPRLQFLDSRRVSAAERAEAAARGQFTRVRRPRPGDERPAPPLRALPPDLAALGRHKSAYGKCNYKYTGHHSEGNRFIVNSDL